MNAVIYQITCGSTRYVGVTRCVFHRNANHFSALESGKHHNRKLQKAFDLSGSYFFDILETVKPGDNRYEAEAFWISHQLETGQNLSNRVSNKMANKVNKSLQL
jgi:hypothetical protein